MKGKRRGEKLTSTPTVPDITTFVDDIPTVGVSAVPSLSVTALGVSREVRVRVEVAAFGVSAVCVAADGGTAVSAFVCEEGLRMFIIENKKEKGGMGTYWLLVR